MNIVKYKIKKYYYILTRSCTGTAETRFYFARRFRTYTVFFILFFCFGCFSPLCSFRAGFWHDLFYFKSTRRHHRAPSTPPAGRQGRCAPSRAAAKLRPGIIPNGKEKIVGARPHVAAAHLFISHARTRPAHDALGPHARPGIYPLPRKSLFSITI